MNNSTSKLRFVDSRHQIYPYVVPIMTGLCLLGFLANVYILIAVRWLRKTPSPIMVLTISLAASDACVALFNLINIVLNTLLPFVAKIRQLLRMPICFALTLEGFRMGTMITAILHLLTIALTHYVGSLRPLHYRVTMTKPVLKTLVLILWTLPTCGILLAFGSIPGQGYHSAGCRKVLFLMSFRFRIGIFTVVTLPLVSMCCIYGHIFLIMRNRRKNSHVRASSRRGSSISTTAGNHKAVVTTSLILGTYIIGWVPSIVLFILICLQDCPIKYTRNHPTGIVAIRITVKSLIILKTLVNPVIYAARVHEIQVAIRRMHAALCCRAWSLSASDEETTRPKSMSFSTRPCHTSTNNNRYEGWFFRFF